MDWIEIKDMSDLPKAGKYVIGKHTRGWSDEDDQENVNTVVVKLVFGISMQERELMAKDIFVDEKEIDKVRVKEIPFLSHHPRIRRSDIYRFGDQFGNNKLPYEWKTFGTTTFFGHEITHYKYID